MFFLSQNEGFSASNQTEVVQLPPGYYIVVGAYRPHQENYALWFSTEINKKGLHAKYGLDAGRKYIYVYLDYYEGYEESIKEMLRVRREGGFDEAWVRIMKDPVNSDQEKAEEKVLNAPIKKSEPVAENEVEVKKIEESKSETVEAVASPDSISSGIVEVIIEEGKITEPEKKIEAPAYSNTSVFFSLLHAQRQEEIEGDVEVIDTDRQRSIEFLKGNLDVTLPDPKSKSGKISLICDLFGYRKIQHDINYIDPMSDTIHDYFDYHEGKFIVHFDMVRLHKGDIATLYNVYFYNDAAVMLPESQYQLTSLLGMLNENPKYKIKLHGHTNGNASGKIIRMGESQNFFALTEDVKEGYGSAKQLSEARAEIIKAYLVANNIKEDRIEIKAWGGARMIHDKNSPNARKNVRVDVEVIED
ncbi:MAG: OmpA family protein [Flammeovirgaceae bacterium]|nr:OmpA family protein [Flammeovirgaceae bacterium]